MENIGILMGGCSHEKDISIKSGETIYKYIDRQKYQPYKIICMEMEGGKGNKKFHFEAVINNERIKLKNTDFSLIVNEQTITFSKIFMIIHGIPGESGDLCTYFEDKKIPYTSCGKKTSKHTFNKYLCHLDLNSKGYQTPKAYLWKDENNHEDDTLNIDMKSVTGFKDFPLIVKPTESGSSFGVHKVYDAANMYLAIKDAKKYSLNGEVVIEEFIKGRELTCAVYKDKNKIITLPITEIISENDIFDYDAKYHGKSIEKTPAKIENHIKEHIQEISSNIYEELNLSGIIRIDFILQNTAAYIIEINTVPGFTEHSIVPQMLKCANINITEFITQQLECCDIFKF